MRGADRDSAVLRQPRPRCCRLRGATDLENLAYPRRRRDLDDRTREAIICDLGGISRSELAVGSRELMSVGGYFAPRRGGAAHRTVHPQRLAGTRFDVPSVPTALARGAVTLRLSAAPMDVEPGAAIRRVGEPAPKRRERGDYTRRERASRPRVLVDRALDTAERRTSAPSMSSLIDIDDHGGSSQVSRVVTVTSIRSEGPSGSGRLLVSPPPLR